MNISDWRQRMDEIDKKLVELLNERCKCALEIGHIKQQSNIPLVSAQRVKKKFWPTPKTITTARSPTLPFAVSSSASLTKPAPPSASPCTARLPQPTVRIKSDFLALLLYRVFSLP